MEFLKNRQDKLQDSNEDTWLSFVLWRIKPATTRGGIHRPDTYKPGEPLSCTKPPLEDFFGGHGERASKLIKTDQILTSQFSKVFVRAFPARQASSTAKSLRQRLPRKTEGICETTKPSTNGSLQDIPPLQGFEALIFNFYSFDRGYQVVTVLAGDSLHFTGKLGEAFTL